MALEEYKKMITNLNVEEQILRNLYLRKLSLGEIQGPPTGYASIDKPWLSNYPEILFTKRKKYNKILDKLMDVWVNEDDEIINYYDTNIKVKDFFDKIKSIAKSLDVYGVKENDIIVSSLESVPEFIELLLACEIIGCSIKNYIGNVSDIIDIINREENTMLYIAPNYLKEIESEKIYKETKIKNIITVDPYYSVVDHSKVKNHISQVINDKYNGIISYDTRNITWDTFLELGKNSYDIKPTKKDTRLFSGFTSGSTGKPKEVIHSSKTVMGEIEQMSLFPSHEKEKDSWLLTILPPTLVAVIISMTCYPLVDGKKLILDPYCKLEDVDLEMMHYEPNCWSCIPIFFDVLLESDRIPENYDMSYFKLFGFGAEQLKIKFINQVQDFLDKHNCKIPFSSGYGQSEGGSGFTVAMGKEMLISGTAGIPLIDTIISIFDPVSGDELGYNQMGEICKLGPGIMMGYNDPELTKETLKVHSDDNTWLHTGDFGFITDRGLLFVLGRTGIKIYPNKIVFPLNIENKIVSISGVKDAIVVSGKDAKNESYELPYLFIIPEKGVNTAKLLTEINQFIDEKLLIEEKPENIYFIDKKPISKFKTDRKILQKEYHLL